MKTFNYESNCVKYKNCFFDLGEYEKGKLSLAIYGYVEDDKNLSHISNATVNVEEKLEENQVVIDNYANRESNWHAENSTELSLRALRIREVALRYNCQS